MLNEVCLLNIFLDGKINNGRNYIHSFSKYVLSVYYVPDTVLGPEDT